MERIKSLDSQDIPMVPGRKQALPKVYGDTPSFLGVDLVDLSAENNPKYDVIVGGVPWEGTVTWGSYSGCEMAPKTIRHASARYGGYLPEYDIDVFDHLRVGDIGDLAVSPDSPERTMTEVCRASGAIYKAGAIPFFLGGDHSFTPEIVRALGDHLPGKIGIIHFDSHLDNNKSFGDDRFPRCGPIHRIAELEKVRTQSIVQIGIRGPRNSPSQMAYAREMGATVFTIRDIRKRGIEEIVSESLAIARRETDHVFVTVCSDCVDAGFNPGGPADFNGLFPSELFSALYSLGKAGIAGMDYVEVYPIQDPSGFSSHLVSWALIHALAGMASAKQG